MMSLLLRFLPLRVVSVDGLGGLGLTTELFNLDELLFFLPGFTEESGASGELVALFLTTSSSESVLTERLNSSPYLAFDLLVLFPPAEIGHYM